MATKTKTVEERLHAAIAKNGVIPFATFEKMFGKKPSELLNKSFLEKQELRVTRLGGEKVLADKNKTKTVLAIIEKEHFINVHDIYELNQWDAHVVGSVFRKSARMAYGISKDGKVLVKNEK